MDCVFYICSKPIHSGKTSFLKQYLQDKSPLNGFLIPDIDGKRKLLQLNTNQVFDIELESKNNNCISIGKYIFDAQVFEIARELLLNIEHIENGYFVIDEIGQLELDDKGFEPSLSKCINIAKSKKNIKTILVVRDYLLQKVLDKYNITHYKLIH